MPTLVQLRTKMRDWLVTSTTRLPDTYCNDLVNEACKEIFRSVDLRFTEKSSSVSCVQGTQGYALPATFSRPIYAYTISPTDGVSINELNELNYDQFRNKYGIAASGSQGDPLDYTIYGTGATPLLVGPTPSRAITLWLDYYEIPADLAADGDTNAITLSNAWEAVLYKALARASKFMLDDERAAVFEEDYQNELAKLRAEHSRARHSGKAFPQMQEPG